MNISVLILFLNATLLPVLSLIIVVTILRSNTFQLFAKWKKKKPNNYRKKEKLMMLIKWRKMQT